MTYLYKIRKAYYFRIRIPVDLRVCFKGREDFKRSLHTTDLQNAQQLVRAWRCKADKIFHLMRSGYMSSDQIRQLADQFFTETLNELEENRVTGRWCPRDEGDLDGYLDNLSLSTSEMREALAYNNLKPVHHVAVDLLQRNNLELDLKGAEFALLCRELLRQLIRINETESRRAVGDYGDLPVLIPDATPSPIQAESLMLSEVITDYLADYKSKSKASGTSLKGYEGIFATMLEVVTDRPVGSLTIKDMLRYQEAMMKLPQYYKTRYKGKTIEELISMGAEKTLSPATLDKAFTMVKSLFSWMVKRGMVEKNIADVLEAPQQKNQVRDLRDPFSPEDIKGLIAGLRDLGDAGGLQGRPERLWVPLIALFTGMRLNEICQLHVEDVRKEEESGIWYFRVEPDESGNKKVKNKSSIRSIPVHSELISLGFLDYYKKVMEAGYPRLWMNLKQGKDGFGRYFQDWFLGTTRYPGGFLRDHVSPGKGKKDFHSFRHTFRNEMKQKLLETTVADELMGHSHGSIGLDRYSEAYHLKVLHDGLLKVGYESVDFSPLSEIASAIINF